MFYGAFVCLLECGDMLLEAVQAVLKDEGFQVESLHAETALKTASLVLEWGREPENREKLEVFSHVLVVRLRACFTSKRTTAQLQRERMWGAYHQLRTADTFVKDWRAFLNDSVGQKAYPAFFQFVTHTVFKELLKHQYPVSEQTTENPERPLTYQEQNALGYVAGYIIRKLRFRREASHHTKMEYMIFLLLEFAGDEVVEGGDTKAWTNIIDRGGLWHINDQTYSLFVALEEECQRFSISASNKEDRGTRKALTEAIMQSEDVLFHWCLISTNSDDDVAAVVLQKIVDLYVTVRGFAFASSCLELYKQAHHKTLQRRRALRSELSTWN